MSFGPPRPRRRGPGRGGGSGGSGPSNPGRCLWKPYSSGHSRRGGWRRPRAPQTRPVDAHRESPTDDTVRTSLDGQLSGIRHRVSLLHALLDGFTQHESHPLRGAGVRDALRETLAELERHLTAVLEMVADRRDLADLHE